MTCFPQLTFFAKMLLSVFVYIIFFVILIAAEDIEQEWTISYKTVQPDGFSKVVPVVNGQYPGPELRGRTGQSVRIVVHNALPVETTTIHWHGIKQTNTVWSDGVPGITQCPIGPGDSFTYSFRLDEPGTLWWHSHSGLQKSSLYGAIVVTGNESMIPHYDEERTLMLNDWFHEDSNSQIAGLLNPKFKWIGDPQALLINGKGTFNCSSLCACNTCNPDHEDAGPFIMEVEPNKVYRLRLIGVSSLAFLNFGIEHHIMTVVQAETIITKPMNVRFLDIGSGQSYSVLLKTKSIKELSSIPKNNGNFWMQLNMRHRKSGPIGLGILRYKLPSTIDSPPLRWVGSFPKRDNTIWSLHQARRLKSFHPAKVPRHANRVFTIVGTQNRLDDAETGRLVWSMNNISFLYPKSPILHSVKFEVEQDTKTYVNQTTIPMKFDYYKSLSDNGLPIVSNGGTQVFKVDKDEVVDFVFQNSVTLGGAEEVHPWHLHLHDFWILGYGDYQATWTPADQKRYKLHRAVSRSTFNLYPNSWTAIRVKFDNPGIAHFHCHILPHLVMGMEFVVQIGEAHEFPPAPSETQFCGTVSKLMTTSLYKSLVSDV